MELNKYLNLNKHPKDYDNLSLVDSYNIKLSNDASCLTNEEGIDSHKTISNYLNSFYENLEYNIVGVIPCNKELVLIVSTVKEKSDIFRYVEDEDVLYHVYDKFIYNGGEIKGTYVYNVENSLIVAISEYFDNIDKNIPIKTINLGNVYNADIYNDRDLTDDMLSLNPTIKIPTINNIDYIKGSSYKGWYNFFIRFKINKVDYTKWYDFGKAIYVDDINSRQIIRYCFPQTLGNASSVAETIMWGNNENVDDKDGYCVGCSDAFSDNSDIANKSFKLFLNNLDNKYTDYQIGLTCTSKTYTKGFKTNDININVNEFIFNINNLEENSIEDFIKEYYNYFNVKNIINYNNRLYISNYKEFDINPKNINVDKIKLNLIKNKIELNDLKYSYLIGSSTNTNNTIEYSGIEERASISFKDYFNVSDDTLYGVSYNDKTHTLNCKNIIIERSSTTLINPYPSQVRIRLKTDIGDEITIYYIDYINLTNGKKGKFICKDFAIGGSNRLINVKNSFETRNINRTLLPGEVYNFFIHFVDKYGNSTNGYKLTNLHKRIVNDEINKEIVPIGIKVNDNVAAWLLFKYDITLEEVKNINLTTLNDEWYLGKFQLQDGTFQLDSIFDDKAQIYLDVFRDRYKELLSNESLKNIKLINIYNSSFVNNDIITFGKYINSNNEELFKIPDDTSNINELINYKLSIEDVTIPNGYEGYFISYEKFESSKQVTGLLTRSDFKCKSKLGSEYIQYPLSYIDECSNLFDSNNMYFYSSKFDNSDSIKLNYNMLVIKGINTFDKNDVKDYDYWQRNKFVKIPYDYNKPAIDINNIDRMYYPMPDYKLVVGDSIVDNREYLGTGLEIKNSYNLFNFVNDPMFTETEDIVTYMVDLYNINNDLYISENKQLIRISEIVYNNINQELSCSYNGVLTYDGTLIYNNDGYNFNNTDFTVYRNTITKGVNLTLTKKYYEEIMIKGQNYSYINNNRAFVNYLQFPVYDDIFYESKHFNNPPINYVFPVSGITEEEYENKGFYAGCLVEPKNSIDLFRNRQGSINDFNIKNYTNYKDSDANIIEFNKTIRRSNIIQDESKSNSWREFPIEGYKLIDENKGNITNLVGIGVYLLVHTEHSLFMFNRDASLQTIDKDLQLYQPDAFDVDYQEIFTSDYGFGGLTDNKSSIVDQFGYIFYNNAKRRLLRFDNGKLDYIDNDIQLWLLHYNPTNIRIANDKYNNRLLIKFDLNDNNSETLSYNYLINKIISKHPYSFENAYNTESKLYIKNKNNILYGFTPNNNYGFVNINLFNINNDINDYGVLNTDGNIKTNFIINIIINNDYERIKFLEYIKYNARKGEVTNIDRNKFPVEGALVEYAGDIIRILSDKVDTGNIELQNDNITITNRYKYPYYELGNWNFNYFRNKLSDPNFKSSVDTRIYGNYICVKFIFENDNKSVIEFESFTPFVSANRTF